MRITFVLPTVGMSGGIRVVAIYAKALAARGHEVMLVSPPPPVLPFRRKLMSFLTGSGWPADAPVPKSHLDGSGLDHRILDRCRPVTDDDVPDADVVVATWWETAEWVNALSPNKGAKVYFIQHHEVFSYLPVLLCQATYRLPMHKVVIARWLKEVMSTQYGDDAVDLVPNSVDRTQFFSAVRGKQSVPTVGFMYSTIPFKSLDVSFAAIKIIRERSPNLRLICFGSVHPDEALPLPKGAEFSFSPSQDQIRNLYSRCDVWITASRTEGFNLPAMEAMACRTPVVSTRTGWPEEAIENGKNGVLVDVDDINGLVSGVEWVLSLPDMEWKRLSNNAYDTVVVGSWEESADKFERALVHACQRASRGEIAGRLGGAGSRSTPIPKPATLKQRVYRAGGWGLGGYGLSQVIRLGGNLILTRLLVPEMFGVMAIATMVTVILSLLSDLGVQQNIVQSRFGNDPAFLDTAWVVQIVRGIILWLVAVLLSILLYYANLSGMFPSNSVYASPVLPLVIAVSSLSAVISGFLSTKVATALRNLDQKRITQVELISQCVGLTVVIVIGVISLSIWALVAGGLVGSLTRLVLSHSWLSGHTNHFRWEKNAVRELIGFGKWIFVSSAVYVFAANGDRLLLGGVVEAYTFGLYSIAVLIVGAIESVINKFQSTVSLPVLSEIAINDPSRLREIYYKLRVPCDLMLLFLMGLLFAAGQLLVDLLYDPRYSATGGMLQVLALSLFAARYGVANQIYLALGIPRYLAINNIVRFVSLYSLVPTLYYLGGTQAAIWGIALHALATVPFVYGFNVQLGLNDTRRELVVLLAFPIGFLCGSALNMLQR